MRNRMRRRASLWLLALLFGGLLALCIDWLVSGEKSELFAPIGIACLMIGALFYAYWNEREKNLSFQFQEESQRQRDAILEAVAFAAERFLMTPDWQAQIDAVLERLGQRTNSSHVYIFENHYAPDGTFLTSMRYEWAAPGIPPDLDNPLFQNVVIFNTNFELWSQTLSRGLPFQGNLHTFLPREAEVLVPRGIRALLDVPIVVGGVWWGIIGFDDYAQVREWSQAEIEALKIAASIISAAIQRQRADEALRESERLYRAAIEAAGAVPYYQEYGEGYDPGQDTSVYTFMSEGIRDLTGFGAGEMTPQVWDTLVQEMVLLGEGAGLSSEEAIRRAWAGELNVWRCDYRIHTRTGETRWIADTAVEILNEQGVSRASIGIMQDISDRKQAEQVLRDYAAQARQRADQLAMLNEVGRAVSTLQDLDSVLEMILEQVQRTFLMDAFYVCLYTAETGEIAFPLIYDSGRRWEEPVDHLEPDSYIGRVIHTGQPLLLNRSLEDIERVRLTGGHFLGDRSRISASSLIAPMQVGARIIGVITAQSYTLNAYADDDLALLHGVAHQAAIAINNARLHSALQQELREHETLIKELEGKNAELERFTYTVSHDLKSPLITIRGFVGFLEKDALAGNIDRLRSDIARIVDATGKMQRLLDELLELSRIGRLMNVTEDLSFRQLALEAIELVAGRIAQRGVCVAVAPELPMVRGDRARLTEVIQNLVDNACKFMGDQPQPRIEIGVCEGGDDHIFFVRDNGIGIDPVYHQKIFGLFDKLDPQSEGTGVGLTLVKRIVEVHGGRIWVDSEGLGRGTAFCFTLPHS